MAWGAKESAEEGFSYKENTSDTGKVETLSFRDGDNGGSHCHAWGNGSGGNSDKSSANVVSGVHHNGSCPQCVDEGGSGK